MKLRAIVLALTALLATVTASGHAVVSPAESVAGQTQQYTLRVPNEKGIATTTVALTMPAEIDVVAVDERAGWQLDLRRDASGKIVSATWNGSLGPGANVEFTFTARNPSLPVTLEWKVIQTFEDASRSEWSGPAGSQTPASRTSITDPAASR